MKKLLFLSIIMCSISSLFSQENPEIKYAEYSYTEFMELLQKEKDTIFKLSNAIIKYDSITDQDFLVSRYYYFRREQKKDAIQMLIIDKAVELENVQFLFYEDFDLDRISSLHSIIFEKDVNIYNSFGFSLSNCVFRKDFEFVSFEYDKYLAVKEIYPDLKDQAFVYGSEFLDKVYVINSAPARASTVDFAFYFGHNHIKGTPDRIFIANWSLAYIDFSHNIFDTPSSYYIQFEKTTNSAVRNNEFNMGLPQLYCIEQDELFFTDNVFRVPSLINFKATNNVNFIGANQFKSTTGSLDGFRDYVERLDTKNTISSFWEINNKKETFTNYNTKEKIENLTTFQYELDQKSVFYNHFKNKHNLAEANKFYIEIKELQSKRLSYEHSLNPTFKTFFKIQINKFLKLFSNYGTEPERGVIVSLYVILFFAFIYLLFPNSWDSLGKKRLIHRFEFFQKYLRRKDGMHTIYLEENAQEISSYEDFKTNLESSKTELPSFFITWSKPLYNASMFSSRLTSCFLKNTDILKGKWTDLSPKQKRWKNIQIGLLLTLGLLYDLFIKALNALMLSINTFTTLGFGEIPIKGLPRYLAIIQGFIGWFMLTIFSVSLISQLLN